MSVSVNGHDSSTDYGDYEYQQLQVDAIQSPSGDQSESGHSVQVEPLGDIGGLANNEVAELVYIEVQATIRSIDGLADQNVATQANLTGVVGANLDAERYDLSDLATQGFGDAEAISSVSTNQTSFFNSSRDEIFQLFTAEHGLPFDDETNGLGGGAGQEGHVYEKNWRQMTGRGPVLDSNDSISVNMRLSQQDSILNAAGQVTVHMVWDVAQTDDAGRAFSVPE